MFKNGEGNLVNLLNDALVTYNNNTHTTIDMKPIDSSNQSE